MSDTPNDRLMNAFSRSGFASKQAQAKQDPDKWIEHEIKLAEFESIFDPAPPLFSETPGGRPSLRVMAKRRQWEDAFERFSHIVDFEVDSTVTAILVESTGGRMVAWEDVRGRVYVAIVDCPSPLYFLPARLFSNPNIGRPYVYAWNNMIRRGGCVPNLPDDHDGIDALLAKNKRNCGEPA
jgi:hypothetical protein